VNNEKRKKDVKKSSINQIEEYLSEGFPQMGK